MDVPVFKAIQPEVSSSLVMFSNLNEKITSVNKYWNYPVYVSKSLFFVPVHIALKQMVL